MNSENVIDLLTVTNIGTAVIAFCLWRALQESDNEVDKWTRERDKEFAERVAAQRDLIDAREKIVRIRAIVAPTEARKGSEG